MLERGGGVRGGGGLSMGAVEQSGGENSESWV